MDQPAQTEPVVTERKKPGPKPKARPETVTGVSLGDPTIVMTDNAVYTAQAVPALDLNDDIARIRAMREKQPFGAFDRKLDLPPIEGYKQHWFNDKPGRIEVALRAGWTHVLDNEGKPKSLIVDSGGLKAFAMKIPEQFWNEDQARQQARATAALNAVKKKPTGQSSGSQPQASDQGAFYTPNASGDAANISRG